MQWMQGPRGAGILENFVSIVFLSRLLHVSCLGYFARNKALVRSLYDMTTVTLLMGLNYPLSFV